MTLLECNARPLRSAVFVDFDNIFIRLSELDQNVARAFATRPLDWISWLESSLPPYAGIDADARRNILVRRCYLNPKSFGNFRPYFIRGAFETVDCPSLTTYGKTSADVHMVVDTLDLLDHRVNYDEFIIMSADADFTPVLLKLRKWDRRTAVLAIGATSPAYRAASDLVIDQDAFIEEALGGGQASPSAHAATGGFAPGFGPGYVPSSQRTSYSPSAARIIRRGNATTEPEVAPTPPQTASEPANRENCAKLIQEFVKGAPEPVTMAQLAYRIRNYFRDVGSDWLGKGSFKQFLAELELGSLEISHVIPGYVFDPERHTPPIGETGAREDEFDQEDPELANFARKIHDLTDTPFLSPVHYQTLFSQIAGEINDNGYNMTAVSKAVRDRCKQLEVPVARQHVNFVLRGIAFTGHRFGEQDESGTALAEKLYANTLNLCENAQLNLSEEETAFLKKWLCKEAPSAA